jgi:hypothetical protein
VIKSQRKGGPGLLLPSTGTASLPPREMRGVGERSLFRRAILRHALVRELHFVPTAEHQHRTAPVGAPRPSTSRSTPQIGGRFYSGEQRI